MGLCSLIFAYQISAPKVAFHHYLNGSLTNLALPLNRYLYWPLRNALTPLQFGSGIWTSQGKISLGKSNFIQCVLKSNNRTRISPSDSNICFVCTLHSRVGRYCFLALIDNLFQPSCSSRSPQKVNADGKRLTV